MSVIDDYLNCVFAFLMPHHVLDKSSINENSLVWSELSDLVVLIMRSNCIFLFNLNARLPVT